MDRVDNTGERAGTPKPHRRFQTQLYRFFTSSIGSLLSLNSNEAYKADVHNFNEHTEQLLLYTELDINEISGDQSIGREKGHAEAPEQ